MLPGGDWLHDAGAKDPGALDFMPITAHVTQDDVQEPISKQGFIDREKANSNRHRESHGQKSDPHFPTCLHAGKQREQRG